MKTKAGNTIMKSVNTLIREDKILQAVNDINSELCSEGAHEFNPFPRSFLPKCHYINKTTNFVPA